MSESNTGEILFYKSEEGDIKISVIFENDTIWLSQKQMGELFGVDTSTINEHLKNIYISGEISEEGTIRKFPIVQKEGNREVKREVAFYNLDSIIADKKAIGEFEKFRVE